MISFIRNLSADQQVTALFLLVFGVLTLATGVLVALSLRERGDGSPDGTDHLAHARVLLRHSWFMTLVFWFAWEQGETADTVLFSFLSFFALR